MQKKITIALVEDDENLRFLVSHRLKAEGYEVLEAADGKQGEALIASSQPDIVLLDWMLPEKQGIDVCKDLRKAGFDKLIIMMTAKAQEVDKIDAYGSGISDYVTKPFGLEELLLRVKAILRRANVAIAKGADVSCGPIIIDEDSHTVKFSGELVELSPTEFRLLQVLIENKNRVLSKGLLLDEVWGITFESESTVADTYISYLRKKLHRDGFEGIKTVRGVGFVIQDPK